MVKFKFLAHFSMDHLYYYYCHYCFTPCNFFSRLWSFTESWVTTILLKSSGLLWLFQPILRVLWSRWCQFFLSFLILPVFFLNFWRPFHAQKLQLVSPSNVCSTTFFSSRAKSKYLSIFLLSYISTYWSAETAKSPRL